MNARDGGASTGTASGEPFPAAVRPLGVSVAAVMLLVIGGVLCAGAMWMLVAGVVNPDEPGGGGMLVLIGLIILPFGIPYLVAGSKLLRLSKTGRNLAAVLVALSILLSVGMIGSGESDDFLFGSGIVLVHLLVLALLVRHGPAFEARGSSRTTTIRDPNGSGPGSPIEDA